MMAAAVYGGLLWTGYRRRKGIWTRRSWILFGGSLLMTFVLIGVAIAMATGVDNGIYNGMRQRERAVYFYTMLALMLGGAVASALLILPFARGNPHLQFGRPSKHYRSGPGTMQQTDLRN
jgi:F0F1-type ATP synthase membrane subunit c/vacuolar-type H+-ATPase subunit K